MSERMTTSPQEASSEHEQNEFKKHVEEYSSEIKKLYAKVKSSYEDVLESNVADDRLIRLFQLKGDVNNFNEQIFKIHGIFENTAESDHYAQYNILEDLRLTKESLESLIMDERKENEIDVESFSFHAFAEGRSRTRFHNVKVRLYTETGSVYEIVKENNRFLMINVKQTEAHNNGQRIGTELDGLNFEDSLRCGNQFIYGPNNYTSPLTRITVIKNQH